MCAFLRPVGVCRGVETGKLGSLCRIWVFNIVLWHSSAQVDGVGRIRERPEWLAEPREGTESGGGGEEVLFPGPVGGEVKDSAS